MRPLGLIAGEGVFPLLVARGARAADLVVHAGPAVCGRCYEVSPAVYEAVTGEPTSVHRTIDLRAIILAHAAAAGVQRASASSLCTRCDNERFFSHRAGDAGRQLAVIIAPV